MLDLRLKSFKKFLRQGIAQSLGEFGEIAAYAPFSLSMTLDSPELGAPERSPAKCIADGLTYDAPLTAAIRMTDKRGEVIEQRMLLCRLPLMDASGGFIISGVRRVVIHQIVRAPGVWFGCGYDHMSGRRLGRGRISPERGPWMGFETNERDELRVRLNGGSSLSALTILRAFGLADADLLHEFQDAEAGSPRKYMLNTVLLGDCNSREEALLQLYREVTPGAPPTLEAAQSRIEEMLFDPQRYSLSEVGRGMLSRRFGGDDSSLLLTQRDLVNIVRHIIRISNGEEDADDIDHLANRRVRTVGELVQREFASGLLDMRRATLEWLQLSGKRPDRPSELLRTTALMNRLSGFFSGSQLCQVTDETNPIAELTHKRRVTSLGPGGLNRRNAGVDPRDVHSTHYGKLCPTETPEGQNIGLLLTLTTGADVDGQGLLTAPVRPVRGAISSYAPDIVGRELTEPLMLDGVTEADEGEVITGALAERLARAPETTLRVRRYVSNRQEDIRYLNAYEEASNIIGQCNARMDELGQLADELIEVRKGTHWTVAPPGDVDYLDLTPRQVVSASTAMIPFLERDDANRALMGCNMQRQAVPLVSPQASLVTTGMEVEVARDSGYQLLAEADGTVVSATADAIEVAPDGGGAHRRYELIKGRRSNSFTWIAQKPLVSRYQRVRAGQPIADGHACSEGELALGQRVLVAYMSWGGYNYEDAIILSSRIAREGKFRSRILKRFKIDAVKTPLGEERITQQPPEAAEWRKQLLGEDGIVPVGTYVKAGQILVGKASPRPVPAEHQDRETMPEQKLLLKIFGETTDNVRYQDKSLLLPKGQEGRVVSVNVIRREDGTDASKRLPPDCHTRVEIEVAGTRSAQPGDKMSGRHGNKGCVAIVVPEEDMPFLPDGTPVDVILSPLGVPSRMNLGQLMEVHLGWAAHRLGFRARTPVFDSANWQEIEQCLAQAWLVERAGGLPAAALPDDDACSPDWKRVRHWCEAEGYSFHTLFGARAHEGTEPGLLCLRLWFSENGFEFDERADYSQLRQQALALERERDIAAPITGKQALRDGKTGEPLTKPVTVGYKYMLKLGHMVSDKMHARSTGTYAAITQQPLRGKSAGGGQRLGEMEVWALEAYSAAYMLREMLTVKSDDIEGRAEMLQAIMASGTGQSARSAPGAPDSFRLLCAELRSLGLNPEFLNRRGEPVEFLPETPAQMRLRLQEGRDEVSQVGD